MRARFASLTLLAACVSVCSAVTAAAYPQLPPHVNGRFVVLPNNAAGHVAPVRLPRAPISALPQWNGGFRDKTRAKITFTMVGPNPAKSNATTTIPVVVIPVKMVFGANNGNTTFDPKAHLVGSTGKSILQLTLASPVFKANVQYIQGGVNLGKTQYIDAFQRGNFWQSVKTNSNYHVVLGSPTVLPMQTITVSARDGELITDGTGTFAMMDINAFDSKLQGFMTQFAAVNPGVLPIFLTYNTYLDQGVNVATCCIGGYHSANGPQPGGQTYAYATFVDEPGAFAQDISALSHEIGEWMDDPFADNVVNCSDNTGGALEVGDPLEGDANYGSYPYSVGGYTYNLQSLVFMPYWGASTKTSVNHWFSFQGTPAQNQNSHDSISGVCPGQ
jgi:hypothetical protein